jgi:hypothetical protein
MRSPAVAVLFALLSSSLATAADGSVTTPSGHARATIDCVFDLKSGKTVDTADFPITVVEVTHDLAAGDPATLLPSVSLPDQPTTPTCASGGLTMTMTGGDLLLGTSGWGWDLPLSRGGSLTTELRCAGDRCAIDGNGLAGTAVPPMPFVVAGVPFCVTGSFRSGPTGSYRCDFECVDELSLAVHANVFLVGDAASPCRGASATDPRDGHKDGTRRRSDADAAWRPRWHCRLPSDVERLPPAGAASPSRTSTSTSRVSQRLRRAHRLPRAGYPEGACHCPSQSYRTPAPTASARPAASARTDR